MDILAIIGLIIYALLKITGNKGRNGGGEEDLPFPRPRKYPPQQDNWDDTWKDDLDWEQVTRTEPRTVETSAAPIGAGTAETGAYTAGTKAAKRRATMLPSRDEPMKLKQVGSATGDQDRVCGETPVPVVYPAPEEQPNPWQKLLTGDNLVQGIVLSEILQPPRALRPFSMRVVGNIRK